MILGYPGWSEMSLRAITHPIQSRLANRRMRNEVQSSVRRRKSDEESSTGQRGCADITEDIASWSLFVGPGREP